MFLLFLCAVLVHSASYQTLGNGNKCTGSTLANYNWSIQNCIDACSANAACDGLYFKGYTTGQCTIFAAPYTCVSTGIFTDKAYLKNPEPSEEPTGQPTSQPSSEPTSQPSAAPPPPSYEEKKLGRLWVAVSTVAAGYASLSYFMQK